MNETGPGPQPDRVFLFETLLPAPPVLFALTWIAFLVWIGISSR